MDVLLYLDQWQDITLSENSFGPEVCSAFGVAALARTLAASRAK